MISLSIAQYNPLCGPGL